MSTFNNDQTNHDHVSVTDHIHDEQARVEEAIRAGEVQAASDFKAEAEKLRAERDELAKKLAEAESAAKDHAEKAESDAQQRLVRLQADWENFRRRTAKERLEEQERATEHMVVNLLPVIDDMERALDHAEKEQNRSESFDQFCQGIEAVRQKMLDVLAKDGVSVIDAKGQPFDPTQHKAVGRVEDESMYNETVHDVYQNGYRMGDKVIRESMVTVSYGGQNRPVEPADQPERKTQAADESRKAGREGAGQN